MLERMRCAAFALLVAISAVACAEPKENTVINEATGEAKTLPAETSEKKAEEPKKQEPLLVATTPSANPPPSPFLVQPNASNTVSTAPTQALTQPQPPPPPPPPPPTTTATNTGGKPCPQGKCLLNNRCVIPGGPVAHEGDPPNVVSGACGGDGGPCHPCRCNGPETPILTEDGEKPIRALRKHDRVLSLHQGRVQAVPILATQEVKVKHHSVARIQLQNGFVLEISGEHPTGDGRALFELFPGEKLGNATVESLTLVPYEGESTFDILPDSDTGTYFAGGLWLGSTMNGMQSRLQGD